MNTQLPRYRRLPLAAGAVILWIAVSPWVWGFDGSRSAVADHVFLVFSFGPLSAMICALRPAAFVTMAGGIWLVLSPWILGYALPHAAWVNETVTGALLVVLSASAADLKLRVRGRRHERDNALLSLESAA